MIKSILIIYTNINFTIKILETRNILDIKTSGDMSGYDYISTAKGLLQRQKWTPNKNIIFDHRKLYFENISFSDIEIIRKFHKRN